jgi:hypothetical protein
MDAIKRVGRFTVPVEVFGDVVAELRLVVAPEGVEPPEETPEPEVVEAVEPEATVAEAVEPVAAAEVEDEPETEVEDVVADGADVEADEYPDEPADSERY